MTDQPVPFRIGDLLFNVTGRGPVMAAFCREVASVSSEAGDLDLDPVSMHIGPDPVRASASGFLLDLSSLGHRAVIDLDQRRVQVQVLDRPGRRWVPDAAREARRRWRNLTFLTSTDESAYRLVNGLTHLLVLLLGESTALLHAATVARGGRALLVSGQGGVGKTSSQLRLVEAGWRYLADDLTPITADGEAHRSPQRMMVYAYNRGTDPLGRRVLAGRGPLDRLHWAFRARRLGPKAVRRRIAAEDLWGSQAVVDRARIHVATFLEVGDVEQVSTTACSPEEMAARNAEVIGQEFRTHLSLVHAASRGAVDPSQVVSRQAALYRVAFETARGCFVVRVPRGTDGTEIARNLSALAGTS